jgi:hypothetical protein
VSAELDLRDSVARTDIGIFVIPYSTIIEMSREHLDHAEEFVSDVIRDNPDYEFEVVHDDFNRAVTIKWRRYVDRAKTRSLDAEISRLDANSKDA